MLSQPNSFDNDPFLFDIQDLPKPANNLYDQVPTKHLTFQIVQKYNLWAKEKGYPQSFALESEEFFFGRWNYGNNFKNISSYPGSYAIQEVLRLDILFPENTRGKVMHLFSGSLPPGNYVRVDHSLLDPCEIDFKGDARDILLHFQNEFDFIFADPPWNREHAERTYKTKLVNKEKVLKACFESLKPGGILVWKDAYKPRYSRKLFQYFGQITVDPSTGHMDRSFRFFRKVV